MSKRKYEPGAFVPVSIKHKSCSPAHAALVRGYREERERQLQLFEAETNGYEGDKKIWKENHTLINFKTWLIANRTNRTTFGLTNGKFPVLFQNQKSDEPNQDYLSVIVRTASEDADSLSRIQRTRRLSIQKEKRNVS